MNVPDPLVLTVIGLVITYCASAGAYVFKKLLEFERLKDTVNELAAKQRKKK